MSAVGFPFKIANGSVQMETSEAGMAQSKIAFAVGTQVGERAMSPSWGIDITNTLWAVGGDLDVGVAEAIELVFSRNFPTHVVHDVVVTRDPSASYRATVEVRYSRADSAIDQTVTTGVDLPFEDDYDDLSAHDVDVYPGV